MHMILSTARVTGPCRRSPGPSTCQVAATARSVALNGHQFWPCGFIRDRGFWGGGSTSLCRSRTAYRLLCPTGVAVSGSCRGDTVSSSHTCSSCAKRPPAIQWPLDNNGSVCRTSTSGTYGACPWISVTEASLPAADSATRLRFFIGPMRPARTHPPKRPKTTRTNAGGHPFSWHHVLVLLRVRVQLQPCLHSH